jgi:hypothetical protein
MGKGIIWKRGKVPFRNLVFYNKKEGWTPAIVEKEDIAEAQMSAPNSHTLDDKIMYLSSPNVIYWLHCYYFSSNDSQKQALMLLSNVQQISHPVFWCVSCFSTSDKSTNWILHLIREIHRNLKVSRYRHCRTSF